VTSETTGPRVPIGLTTAVGLSLIILIGLGLWQLQRLSWKQGLLRDIATARAAAAVMVTPDQLEGSRQSFAKVTAICPGLATAPFIELYGLVDGEAGVRLISACPMPGLRQPLLVDRGFVADTVSARPVVNADDRRPVGVRGYLRLSEARNVLSPPDDPSARRYYVRDTAILGRALGIARPGQIMLVAETSSNPDWKALHPQALPPELPNNHLSYALTRFGLALGLAGVYAAMLRRRVMANGSMAK